MKLNVEITVEKGGAIDRVVSLCLSVFCIKSMTFKLPFDILKCFRNCFKICKSGSFNFVSIFDKAEM